MQQIRHLNLQNRAQLCTMPLWLILLSLSINHSLAEQEIVLSRYTLQQPTATAAQTDPLSVTLKVNFPPSITTIGDAIDYLLLQSGFSRVVNDDVDAMNLMQMRLPKVHRSIGPISLKNALLTISGEPWKLTVNNIQRTISISKSPEFNYAADKNSQNINPGDGGFPSDQAVNSNNGERHFNRPSFTGSEQNFWQLNPLYTLHDNFHAWCRIAGWKLLWNSTHDYEINFSAEFTGSFKEAVAKTLAFYRDAPVPVLAEFYDGNDVLVIRTANTSIHH